MKRFVLTTLFVSAFALAWAQTPSPTEQAVVTSTISFVETTHDFGEVPQGKPVTYVFEFTNTGQEPLIINEVKSSCGCTVPEWTKEPVMPGSKGLVKATYNAAKSGVFNKPVTVLSNSPAGPVMLYLKGTVVEASQLTGVPKNDGNNLLVDPND